MVDLLPSSPDTSAVEEPAPRVLGLDSEDADELLSALNAETARRVLSELHEDPSNAAALADRVDTSLQNVQYHLGNLEEAGLVEVIDTVYSEKGREMKVYAPADRPLVVVAGREADSAGLKSALSRLLGGVALLGVLSAVVQWVVGGPFLLGQAGSGGDAGAVSTQSESVGQAAGGAATALPPGLLFFLGGLAVLLVGVGVWYVRR